MTCYALFVLFASASHAAYVQRFTATTNGAMTFTGNTLGLDKRADQNEPGTVGAIGAFTSTNTLLKVGNYPNGTTLTFAQNSSSSILNIPSGSTVLYAELIWGGSYATANQNVSSSLGNAVTFMTPAGTTSVSPTAATSQTLTGSGRTFYVRSANVTTFVQSGGAGTYTCGGVPATIDRQEDNANAAGWTLAVVYNNPALTVRNLTLFVGAELTDTTSSPTSTVSGFCTPQSGTVQARLLVSAIEGDAVLTGDQLRFGPSTANLTPISGPNNPVNNFFASQINGNTGALDTSGTFGNRNHIASSGTGVSGARQGWDITNVDVSAFVTNNQNSAVVQGTTTGDRYVITAVGTQIDVGAPVIPTTIKTVDKPVTFVGDVLTYTINVTNETGTAEALNVILTDVAPTGTSFVAGSLSIDGVTQPTANPATGINLGTILKGSSKRVRFQVRVNSIPAAPNPAEFSNTATITYGSPCGAAGTQSVTTNPAITRIVRLEPTKTSDVTGAVSPGQIITYTISIPNSSTVNSSGTTLADAIPAGTTYVAGSTTLNGAAIADTGGFPYSTGAQINGPGDPAGQISGGATSTITFQVRVGNTPPANIINSAVVDPDGPGPAPAQTVSTINTVAATVTGVVYNDLNANAQLDAGETGAGITGLFAKIIPAAGGNAVQAVPVNATTGVYTFNGVAAGTYSIIIDNNNTLSDTTAFLPTGRIGTEAPNQLRTNVVVAGGTLSNQNFGLFSGSRLSGTVFNDNGAGNGTPNDGIRNGGEVGLAAVSVRLTDAAGTTLTTTTTDSSGNYTLLIPSSAGNTSLRVVEVNPTGFISVGARPGTTGGTYDRTADAITFTNTPGTTYTGVNFADVPVNTFVNNDQRTALAGSTVIYTHTYTAGTGGQVTFTTSNTAAGWTQRLFRDTNCNRVLDTGEPEITGAITVIAGEQVCLLLQETVPSNAAVGTKDTVTINAAFSYTNATPALTSTLSVVDVTTSAGSGLSLTKTVDKPNVKKGDVITYTITYRNISTQNLNGLVIDDAIPTFTTFVSASTGALATNLTGAVIAAPNVGSNGTIRWTFTGVLLPGSQGTVTFQVQLQ
ncbi:MAG TPA: SdrD B-like domain-containing protein [Abditibacteriaceae bacterium]|jgi:uncharacterized repeat protein (TIGR01451 family)